MIDLMIKCFWFLLPAYFANMAPVIVKKLKFLNFPIDFNAKIGNKPVLGRNKTFRGLFFGVMFAILIAYIQSIFYNKGVFNEVFIVDYSNWLLLGFLMGFGAIIGDSFKSFFKRRLGYEPGQRFIPFDQTDFVIGALIFTYFIAKPDLEFIITALLLSFVLHIIVNHISFYTGIRKEKW